MKKISCAVLLLLLLASSAFAMKNEPDGFRGIKWGDPYQRYAKEMKAVEQMDDAVIYTRTGDSLKLGDAKLSVIAYLFHEARFAAVFIQIEEGRKNIDEALLACKVQWGAPDGESGEGDFYWLGKNAAVIFQSSDETGDPTIIITGMEFFNTFFGDFEQQVKEDF